jgi:hypothetical protein
LVLALAVSHRATNLSKHTEMTSNSDFLTWSQAAHAIGEQTGQFHSPHNIATAARRQNLAVTDEHGREGTKRGAANKLAKLWRETGYFTPRPGHGSLTAA